MMTIWDTQTKEQLIDTVQRLTAENEHYRQALNSNGTDLEIAQDLFDRGKISEAEFVIWKHRQGYETLERAELWRRFPRPQRTLRAWVAEVRLKIIERRQELQEGRLRYGHSIASGSDVRHAGDPTAQGRLPSEESTWSEERLRVNGALDRWSRKRK